MFEISVVMDFSAAHNLRGYKGKCEALHGHNWKVEAVFAAKSLDRIGMVEDFSSVKERLRSVLAALDHRYLNDVAPFKKVNPTSENIAKFIFRRLADGGAGRARIARVRVWETEKCCAIYYEK